MGCWDHIRESDQRKNARGGHVVLGLFGYGHTGRTYLGSTEATRSPRGFMCVQLGSAVPRSYLRPIYDLEQVLSAVRASLVFAAGGGRKSNIYRRGRDGRGGGETDGRGSSVVVRADLSPKARGMESSYWPSVSPSTRRWHGTILYLSHLQE